MKKIKPIPLAVEFQIEFETNDGVNIAYFLGKNKKEAKEHFNQMNKKGEPLKVLKVSKV